MVPKICSIPECEKKRIARGWCDKHWSRWRKFGDPLGASYQPTPCAVAGCGDLSVRRGWCDPHYRRFMKWGDPIAGAPTPGSVPALDRFKIRVEKGPGCWNWQGYTNPVGYGSIKVQGSQILAHRFSWKITHGEIPEGMQIDHICMNKSCVNPNHLRLVTPKQNGEHKDAPRNNTSGYRGVTKGYGGKWRAQVRHNGTLYQIGQFEDVEEANRAVVAKRLELFTHNELDKWRSKA